VFVIAHDAELKVTSVGSTVTMLWGVKSSLEYGAVGASSHALTIPIVNSPTIARRILIMRYSSERVGAA
jgi:hypothetical protein